MKIQTNLLMLMLLAGAVSAQQVESTPPADAGVEQEAKELDVAAMIASESNIGVLLQVYLTAREKKDYLIMEQAADRMVVLRPHVSDFGMLLVRAYSLQDKKSQAYDRLLKLERRGLYFDLLADEDLINIRDTEVFNFLVHQFDTNAAQLGAPQVVARLQRNDLLTDGLTWDSNGERLLIGSVTEGTIYAIADDGTLEPFITANAENGLLGVFDIAVDAERDALWVTSNAVAHYKGIQFSDQNRGGVWKFKLSTGEYQTRLETPRNGNFFLTDLTVASDGMVYVVNGRSPAIYKVDPEAKQLQQFISSTTLTGIRALTTDADAQTLYFADYELGVFMVDIKAERMAPIVGPGADSLGGVDDLFLHDDKLIMIQNGSLPHRVVRLTLKGNVAEKVDTLLSGQPDFQSPASGVLVGNRVHVVSSSHWNAYDPNTGKLLPGVDLSGPAILAADINVTPGAVDQLFDPEKARERIKARYDELGHTGPGSKDGKDGKDG